MAARTFSQRLIGVRVRCRWLLACSALLTFSIARNVGVLAILGLAVLTQDTQEDTQKYLSLS